MRTCQPASQPPVPPPADPAAHRPDRRVGPLPRLQRLRDALIAEDYHLCSQKAELLTDFLKRVVPETPVADLLSAGHFQLARTAMAETYVDGRPQPRWKLALNARLEALYHRLHASRAHVPRVVWMAHGLHHVLAHAELRIYEDELIVGNCTRHRIGAALHPDYGGILLLPELRGLPTRAVNPIQATPAQLGTDGELAAGYEGLLVVTEGSVTAQNPPAGPGDADPTNEFVLDEALRVNDLFFSPERLPERDDNLRVTGVLRFANGDSKLEPRSPEDIQVLDAAPAVLVEPANSNGFAVEGADAEKGAFVPPMLFHCETPDSAQRVHDTEAFGPVSTVMGYRDLDHAIALANRGEGSLVASVITHDAEVARAVALGSGAFHGRLYFNNRDSMKESTGHGSPLPHMVHGGPGRAGGGEELGGVRGVKHYMQRTAIQGSPEILSAIGEKWVPGGTELKGPAHPFTRKFGELAIGETLHSASRQVTLEDIETFAHFTGDTFYAHMDDEAAKRNPFFPGRVAHGYLLLSFAAGLFVQPDEGPVLANTGLDSLRFMKPVEAGDSIKVRLTVKKKTPRNEEYGEVRWHVTLTNQEDEMVAEYELLTMNAF